MPGKSVYRKHHTGTRLREVLIRDSEALGNHGLGKIRGRGYKCIRLGDVGLSDILMYVHIEQARTDAFMDLMPSALVRTMSFLIVGCREQRRVGLRARDEPAYQVVIDTEGGANV